MQDTNSSLVVQDLFDLNVWTLESLDLTLRESCLRHKIKPRIVLTSIREHMRNAGLDVDGSVFEAMLRSGRKAIQNLYNN